MILWVALLIEPLGWLIKKSIEWTRDSNIAILDAQKKAAVEIIKAGKEAGVDNIELTVDESVGVHLGFSAEGIPKATPLEICL